MAVINTNIAATITSNALAKNERAMGQTMERLSTGQRINSAADDAAGLAISSKMTSQIRGLDQAVRNGNDAISMIQTADGAMLEVTNMLQRMRELTVQAASNTNGNADLTALNTEFEALTAQIQSISENTEWNGKKLLDGSAGSIAFQVGANASQTISIEFADLNVAATTNGNSEATESGTDPLDIFNRINNTIIGSGTVANEDTTLGASCFAERRTVVTLRDGKPSTPFMKFGDVVRIEMNDRNGASVFGAIEQKITAAGA
mgnify:CR=1 FL=1